MKPNRYFKNINEQKAIFTDGSTSQSRRFSIEEAISELAKTQIGQQAILIQLLDVLTKLNDKIDKIETREKIIIQEKTVANNIPSNYLVPSNEAPKKEEEILNFLDQKSLSIDAAMKGSKLETVINTQKKIIKQNHNNKQ